MRGYIQRIIATKSFGLTLSLSTKDPSVNKLDLLFDPHEFAAVFRAAIGASSSVFQASRPDAAARSQGEAASVGGAAPSSTGRGYCKPIAKITSQHERTSHVSGVQSDSSAPH
jgi:hypothetical protein